MATTNQQNQKGAQTPNTKTQAAKPAEFDQKKQAANKGSSKAQDWDTSKQSSEDVDMDSDEMDEDAQH